MLKRFGIISALTAVLFLSGGSFGLSPIFAAEEPAQCDCQKAKKDCKCDHCTGKAEKCTCGEKK